MHSLPYKGRTPLLGSRAMKKITRFAAAFVAVAVFAGPAFAGDPYRVKDLVVDKVAPSAAEAIQQGTQDARLAGAQRLIERLTLAEDRQRTGQPIDYAEVARLYASQQIQVQQKTFSVAGGVRATSVISQQYDKQTVREYLEARNVPYVDAQAANILIVPVVTQGIDPNAWQLAWSQTLATGGPPASAPPVPKSDDTVLTPYVASNQTWTRRPGWSDVQQEIAAARADHAVISEVYSQNGQYYVRLVDLRTGVAQADLGVAGPFADLPSAQAGAIAELERLWKMQSVIRTSGSSNVRLVAMFNSLPEWVKIRKGVEASRLISSLLIESISAGGADLSFVYAGRPDQLQSDLRSRGIDLRNDNGGWVLQVVSAQ